MNAFRTTDLDGDFRRDPKTRFFCCRCQKDIKPGAPYRVVHLVANGWSVLHPADEALYAAAYGRNPTGSDFGPYPIGMDCARRIGREWTTAPDAPPMLPDPSWIDARKRGAQADV